MYQTLTQEGEPINIALLDKATTDFYDSRLSDEERINLNNILIEFSGRKDIFLFIQQIISSNCQMITKLMSINAFKNYVNSSWLLVPDENRHQLRQYMWNLLFEEKINFGTPFRTKIIEIIVCISKYEYPQLWPTFIQELLSISETLENACTALNCIEIFSQEISEFADNSLTSVRAAEMLNSFNQELQNVIGLIQKSLSSDVAELVSQSLKTFCSLVKWIDSHFFFETNILDNLCSTYLDNKMYTSIIIKILGEIVSINYIPEEYYPKLGPIFSTIISKLQPIHDESVEDFYNDPSIISLLATTLTSFLSQYYEAVEAPEYSTPLIILHQWLVELTSNNDENLDSLITYWYELSQRIYSDLYIPQSAVRAFYEPFLPSIRRSLIAKIPSPYYFADMEEEDGYKVHRVVFSTKFGDLFISAKETLILLTKLDLNDTIHALDETFQAVKANGFGRLDLIERFGWSFGAIVGALSEQSNKLFVTNILVFYVSLFSDADSMQVDLQIIHQAKRVVAMVCCFMCSQSHKFLMRDNDLFISIINWMLSLLQYPNDEVKAVAIHCLQLLCSTNSDQMTAKPRTIPQESQQQSSMSILEQILANFQNYYSNLSESSLYSLFSLTAALIKNVTSDEVKEQMFKITVHFLDVPLQQMLPLQQDINPQIWHGLTLLVQCNNALAISLGNFYVSFFLTKFDILMDAFSTLTNFLSQYQNQQGTDIYVIKSARTTSDAIISLLERTINYCYEGAVVREKLFPICMTVVLQNFANTPPIAKSSKVLKLFGTLATKCHDEFIQNYRVIFDSMFIPVFQMIHDDFISYEYIRSDFFDFMLSVVRSCMDLIMSLSTDELNIFIDGIKFGMRHQQNEISEKSHSILTEFINGIKMRLKDDPVQLANFTTTYAIPLLMFAFEIMTDTSHKSSFMNQVSLIKSILTLPSIPELVTPLFENLCSMFNDQPPEIIQKLLIDMMNTVNNPGLDFNNVLKDFLVSVKHLLPQDPDLIAAQKKDALKKTQEFFKKIDEMAPSPLGNSFPGSL